MTGFGDGAYGEAPLGGSSSTSTTSERVGGEVVKSLRATLPNNERVGGEVVKVLRGTLANKERVGGQIVKVLRNLTPSAVAVNADLTGSGTLSATVVPVLTAIAPIGGTGDVSAVAAPVTAVTGSLGGAGTLSSASAAIIPLPAALGLSGAFAADITTAIADHSVAGGLGAGGVLSASASVIAATAAPIGLGGYLSATVSPVAAVVGSSFATRSLVATTLSSSGGSFGSLASTGTLTANVALVPFVAADAVLNGAFSAIVDRGASTADGRGRDGYAIAEWDPPVEDAPAAVRIVQAREIAEAYDSVTMTGTRPTIHGAKQAVKIRAQDRIIIAGRDVTYWRGVTTPLPSYNLIEPLLYGAGTLSLPQVSASFERLGHGSLSWLKPGASIKIQRVNPTTRAVVATDFIGFLLAPDINGRTLSFDIVGEVTGLAGLRDKQPPIFKRRADIGYMWWDAITDLKRPFKPVGGPNTGVKITSFGGTGFLDYLNQLSALGVNGNGTQWTCMPGIERGIYQVHPKDRTTVHATAYLDDAHTVGKLRRDPAEEPNRIFGSGVAPSGRRVKFGVYPVLADYDPPPYPNHGGAPMHPGDTDDDTDSGGGVTAMIARLSATGYLSIEDRPGGWDDDVTDAIGDLRDDAGMPPGDNMNPQLWGALFDIGVTGYSLGGSHIEPAAERSKVKRYLRTGSGNIIGPNPDWDRNAIVIDRTIDFGTGFTRRQMKKWAHNALAPTPGSESGPNNWVGTIEFGTGALISGEHNPGDALPQNRVMSSRDLRPGMNIWLPMHDGGTLVHVSGAEIGSDGKVSATVDTQARDTMAVWEVIQRRRDSRRDTARSWLKDHRSSSLNKDAVTEFDEFGGVITPTDLNAGWNVVPVVAGQEGTIARLRLKLDRPAEFVTAVFGQRIRRGELASSIGNPLEHAGAKKWVNENVRRRLDKDYVLLYVAGDDQSPCGYFPGTKNVRTYTPMHDNPKYNVSVPKTSPAYDNTEKLPDQVPNPLYNPDDSENDNPTIDKVVHDETTPLTGRWDDDASFGYRTFDHSCVIWLAIYVLHDNKLGGGRVMWPQLESGS